MWSFFSRDTSKDFPYEIVDNVAGKRDEKSQWNYFHTIIFPIFLLFFLNLCPIRSWKRIWREEHMEFKAGEEERQRWASVDFHIRDQEWLGSNFWISKIKSQENKDFATSFSSPISWQLWEWQSDIRGHRICRTTRHVFEDPIRWKARYVSFMGNLSNHCKSLTDHLVYLNDVISSSEHYHF